VRGSSEFPGEPVRYQDVIVCTVRVKDPILQKMDSADGAPTLADAFDARFPRGGLDFHESTAVLQFLHDQQPSVLLLAQQRREDDNTLLAAEQRVSTAFARVAAGLRALSVASDEALTVHQIRQMIFDRVLEDGRGASASLDHMRSCASVRIHLLITDALEARALARHGPQLQIAAATSRDH
jgi:hypothetical protein